MVALVGLMITFGLYYFFAYEPILRQYQAAFLQKPANVTSVPGFEQISWTVFRPTTLGFSNFVERKMVIRMENQGDKQVSFVLTAFPEPGSEYLRIRSESNLESDEYTSAFDVTIPPKSIREIDLYLSVEHIENNAKATNFKMSLYVNGNKLSFGANSLDFSYEPLTAFRESAIRFLLFPPFSNVFLASLVFFVVGGVEERKSSLLFVALQKMAEWFIKHITRVPLPKWQWLDLVNGQALLDDMADIAAWLVASGLLFLSLSFWAAGLVFPGLRVWIIPFWLLGGLVLFFALLFLLLSVKTTPSASDSSSSAKTE